MNSSLQTPISSKKLILIVDDLAENLQVLAGHLTEAGYEVLAANSGARALALVNNRKPDLILLDILMPVMDGFAVCQALKEDPHSADIPVIFITARTETEDVVQGLAAGAVDYVTKPFKSAELLARVKTHIELKSSRDLCTTYNEQLKRIGNHLRRLNDDKNRFLSIVSHDIRGAFGNVVSVSRLLTDPDPLERDEAHQLLTDIGIEAEHMISLAQNLLNIDAIERQEIVLKPEIVDPRSLIEFSIQAHQMTIHAKDLKFDISCDDTPIYGDLTACRQILINLVSNAVKYSPPGSTVWISSLRKNVDTVELAVTDEGAGLSEADQKKLFQPFTRLNTKTELATHSVGLGLSIVKLMSEGMGGKATAISRVGCGSTFFIQLPAAP